MRATTFEFRYRFFVFAVLFGMCLSLRWTRSSLTFAESIAAFTGHPTRLTVQLWLALGGLIIVAAAALRTWATAYLQAEVVHDMAMHSERLVADGPYRYVRNPLYLGMILLSAGMGFLAPAPNWIFLVLATLLFNLRLIFREEACLKAEHSQSFAAFQAAVPRLLPALTPRLPASGRRPRWRQAWLAESFMWAFAVALLTFSLTFSRTALLVIILPTLLAYAILHVVNSQRLASRPA